MTFDHVRIDSETQTPSGSDHTQSTDDDQSTRPTRRQVLKGIGAAGVTTAFGPGLGSAQDGHTLDLSIWQTKRMATMAKNRADDRAHAQLVMQAAAENYYGQFVEVSDVFADLNVQIRTPAIGLDTTSGYDNPPANIVARLYDYNGQLHGEYEPSTHANLLIDSPVGGRAIGVGFMAPDDTIGGNLTDASMLDYGEYLLDLDPENLPEEVHLIDNNEIPDRGFAAFVLQAGLQEIGHNLLLDHREGMGKEVGGVAAATPMTSAYMLSFGGTPNACGTTYPAVEYTGDGMTTYFKDDFMLLTQEAADCAVEHFAADARDWADQQGAASMGVGGAATTGQDDSDETKPHKLSPIPKPLYDRITAD